jgi:hypothetical protein
MADMNDSNPTRVCTDCMTRMPLAGASGYLRPVTDHAGTLEGLAQYTRSDLLA